MRRIIGSTLFLLASAGWASAALGPLEAAAILAEARATNAKCSFLSSAEADNLSQYSARAEVVAVSAVTPHQAAGPLQQARARGSASACDAAAAANVREIYAAAQAAMDQVTRETAPATGPINILPQPRPLAPQQAVPPQPIPVQPLPPPVQHQVQLAPPQPRPQPQAPAPVLLVAPAPAPAPVPAPAPAPVPVQPQVRNNFSAQQPVIQPAPLPQPEPQPQPQYVYAQPEPEPVPQYVYAQPAPEPEPVPQYAYAIAQPQWQPQPQPQPQPIVSQKFLARFSVVLERPEPQPVLYQVPAAVYAPEPIYTPVSDVSGGLGHYGRRAHAYYVEIRCQHLNPQQARQFWQSIAVEHAAMLERESAAAIESTLAQARAQADQMACSSQSAALVQQVFQAN